MKPRVVLIAIAIIFLIGTTPIPFLIRGEDAQAIFRIGSGFFVTIFSILAYYFRSRNQNSAAMAGFIVYNAFFGMSVAVNGIGGFLRLDYSLFSLLSWITISLGILAGIAAYLIKRGEPLSALSLSTQLFLLACLIAGIEVIVMNFISVVGDAINLGVCIAGITPVLLLLFLSLLFRLSSKQTP